MTEKKRIIRGHYGIGVDILNSEHLPCVKRGKCLSELSKMVGNVIFQAAVDEINYVLILPVQATKSKRKN